MLAQAHTHTREAKTEKLTPFEAGYLNRRSEPGQSWQADPERFQLVADEAVKVGQPVNRDEALYWAEQIRVRAGKAAGWLYVPQAKEVAR